MSPDADSSEPGEPGGGEPAGFELPLPDDEPRELRLRRGVFGIRAADARAQIEARDAEIAELRRDQAALWLAFGQHERAIAELLATLERLGARAKGPLDPSPPPTPATASMPVSAEPRDSVGEQLSSLDEVLAAIATATDSLERTYRQQLSGSDPVAEPSPEDGPRG